MALRSLCPKLEPVAAGELGRHRGRTLELVDHLAFGEPDPAERDREAQLLGHELHRDLADPDLAHERMGAAVAALGRVGEAEHEALVAARERLEPQGPVGGVIHAARG